MSEHIYGSDWSDQPEYVKKPELVLEPAAKKIDPLLYQLCSFKTPHKKEGAVHHLMPDTFEEDKLGNRWYRIGKSETMFSCHMDTVHWDEGRIVPMVDKNLFVYAKDLEGKASVLGADDKVGMFIMLKMMQRRIPGLYVFHVGEEKGCVGSHYIADNNKDLVKGMKRCIAFDRKGYSDAITFQRGGRTCSDDFALALSNRLNPSLPPRQRFSPCPNGVYTDSANYTQLIPECTNLSVGYFDAHGTGENFDYVWLKNMLLPAIMAVEWEALPTKKAVDVPYKHTPAWENWGKNRNTHLSRMQGTNGNKGVVPFRAPAAQDPDYRTTLLPFSAINMNTDPNRMPRIRINKRIPSTKPEDALGLKACLIQTIQVLGYAMSAAHIYDMMCLIEKMESLCMSQSALIAQQISDLDVLEKENVELKARNMELELDKAILNNLTPTEVELIQAMRTKAAGMQ